MLDKQNQINIYKSTHEWHRKWIKNSTSAYPILTNCKKCNVHYDFFKLKPSRCPKYVDVIIDENISSIEKAKDFAENYPKPTDESLYYNVSIGTIDNSFLDFKNAILFEMKEFIIIITKDYGSFCFNKQSVKSANSYKITPDLE